MRLRLSAWWRRPETAGRHRRVAPPVTVASAAGTLVASTAAQPRVHRVVDVPAYVPVEAYVDAPHTTESPEPREPELVELVLPTSTAAPVATAFPSVDLLPERVPDLPVDGVPAVSLGFIDGAELTLHPDDPRAAQLRAAAAALIDGQPR